MCSNRVWQCRWLFLEDGPDHWPGSPPSPARSASFWFLYWSCQHLSYTATPEMHCLFLVSLMITTNSKVGCLHQASQLGVVLRPDHWCAYESHMFLLSFVIFTDLNAKWPPYSYAPSSRKFTNDTASSSHLTNDAARQAQWSNIAGGIPNIAYEGQIYGGHHQCNVRFGGQS